MTAETAIPPAAPPKDALRDAATVIVLRRDGPVPRVLMGQRGHAAAFMPSKFVFPGGAVDLGDAAVPGPALPDRLARMLAVRTDPALVPALPRAAVRELWEETGLALSHPGTPEVPEGLPADWHGFFAAGHRPAVDRLELVFRAITPPGRPRRFDARFFMVDAEALVGDPDDFSRACEELSHLSWVALAEARRLDLPFITEVVLGELSARLDRPHEIRRAPFFHHAEGRSFIDPL